MVDAEVDASVGGAYPATPKRRVGRPTTNARDAARQFEEKELAVKRVTRQATRVVANDDGNGQTIVARTAATSGGDGKAMLQRVLEGEAQRALLDLGPGQTRRERGQAESGGGEQRGEAYASVR